MRQSKNEEPVPFPKIHIEFFNAETQRITEEKAIDSAVLPARLEEFLAAGRRDLRVSALRTLKSKTRCSFLGVALAEINPMRQRVLIALLLWIICVPSLFAQNRYNFSQFGNETIEFIKQPTRWEGNDWLRIGLVGAGTFLVMQVDQPIRDAVMKDRSAYNSTPVKFGKLWGETYSTAIFAGAFGLHGLLTNDNSTKKVGFEIVQAALYSGGITTILKAAIGRARPYTDKGAGNYQPFTILDDGLHSLPSGHATLAFALSTVLSRNADSKTLKVLAFVPAALTAFSRIYQDYHWTSDCVLGAVIGYVVATWVVDLHDSKETPVHLTGIYPLTIRINLN